MAADRGDDAPANQQPATQQWGRDAEPAGRRGLARGNRLAPPAAGPGTYRYVRRGRNALSAVGLAGAGAVLATGWSDEVSLYWWLGALAVGAWAGYYFVADPEWGMAMDAHEATFFDGSWRESVPLSEIEEIDVVRTTEEDVVRLLRRDRSRFKIPTSCYESIEELAHQCALRGVRIVGADGPG